MPILNVAPLVDVYMDTLVGTCVNNDDLLVRSNYTHQLAYYKVALKFDLSSLAGATITSAKLYMKQFQTIYGAVIRPQPVAIKCRRHNTPANITNAMTAAQMNDYTSTVIATAWYNYSTDYGNFPLWHMWDVTSSVIAGQSLGLLIWNDPDCPEGTGYHPQGGNMDLYFRSSNYATPADRPYLQITTAASGFVPRCTIC